MPSQDDIDRLRLARTEGVGPLSYHRLLARHRSAAAALEALPGLAQLGGRSGTLAVPGMAEAWREFEQTAKLGARLIFFGDPDYPPMLAQLEDAPPVIAVLGDAALLARPAIAIVGGRNASAAGLKLAELLAEQLAAHLTVVSGLARGIDGIAHTAAMRTGRTVAAVAGGLDVTYPMENANLQWLIGERGALLSEAPPGTQPRARHFPRRNRLIAGLALGVVVVEAARRSGSLITARIAQDLGREIFAVPGSPLDPRARGGNELLRDGAVLTETAEDVLDNLAGFGGLFTPRALEPAEADAPCDSEDVDHLQDPPDLDAARHQVVALLSPTPVPVDDLVRRCQLSPAAVRAVLLELELAGRVETLPGNRFALLTTADS